MDLRLRRVLHGTVALPMIVASLPCAGTPHDPFAQMQAVRDDRLDALRGGFDNGQGMQFSFAIERAVVINGELISSTRLVLNDLMPLLSGGVANVQIINSAREIVQNGLGNTVSAAPQAAAVASVPALTNIPVATPAAPLAPAPVAAATVAATPAAAAPVAMAPVAAAPVSAAPAAAAPVVAIPVTAAPIAAAPVTTTPAAPAPIAAASAAPVSAAAPVVAAAAPASVTPASTPAATAASASPAAQPLSAPAAAAAPLYVQMNAGGQVIVVPNAAAIVSAVQNTVNNQIIQARTTIDAALNTVSALRANTLTQAIRDQALSSARR